MDMGLERAAAALLPQKQSGGLFLARGRVPRRKAQVGTAFALLPPRRGEQGDFYPLSHFVTVPPEQEPRGKRIATSAVGLLAMTCVIRQFPE